MTREELIRNLTYVMKKHENDVLLTFDTNISLMCKDILDYLEQEPILDKIIADIKEWYWQTDRQALAKDPCVVDVMIDLFIQTIDKYREESEN